MRRNKFAVDQSHGHILQSAQLLRIIPSPSTRSNATLFLSELKVSLATELACNFIHSQVSPVAWHVSLSGFRGNAGAAKFFMMPESGGFLRLTNNLATSNFFNSMLLHTLGYFPVIIIPLPLAISLQPSPACISNANICFDDDFIFISMAKKGWLLNAFGANVYNLNVKCGDAALDEITAH